MRTVLVHLCVLVYFLVSSSPAFSLCFDFSQKVTTPIRDFFSNQTNNESLQKDLVASGKNTDDVTWAAVRGIVDHSILDLLKMLYDHNTTKSKKVTSANFVKIDTPHYLELHQITFEVHPFPLITIEWTEAWGYALKDGTKDNPNEVVISYEKIKGTSHIEHLCGNIILKKLSPESSLVYLYEEAKATQRSVEDTKNGEIGTLNTLRGKSNESKPK